MWKLLAAAIFYGRWILRVHPHEWQTYNSMQTRTLLDGSTARGRMMRRYVGGDWQYRHMTDDEAWQQESEMAW
jgi:hypothetical protein